MNINIYDYEELKNGNLSIIIIGIILSGMGLYIALVLAHQNNH